MFDTQDGYLNTPVNIRVPCILKTDGEGLPLKYLNLNILNFQISDDTTLTKTEKQTTFIYDCQTCPKVPHLPLSLCLYALEKNE